VIIVAVGAAPFGEMPSSREILQRVRALVPEAGQNEPDQHVLSQIILKQFTQPWGRKGELLLASLNVRHPERKIARGGPARFGKIPNYLRFASSSAEDLWGATETRLHEPLAAIKRDGRVADPVHETRGGASGSQGEAVHHAARGAIVRRRRQPLAAMAGI
jgi:hypothetical protein